MQKKKPFSTQKTIHLSDFDSTVSKRKQVKHMKVYLIRIDLGSLLGRIIGTERVKIQTKEII